MKITNIKASVKIDDFTTLLLLTSYYNLNWVVTKCEIKNLTYRKQANFIAVKLAEKYWLTFFRVGNSGKLHYNVTGCKSEEELKHATQIGLQFLLEDQSEIKASQSLISVRIDNITAVGGQYKKNSVNINHLRAEIKTQKGLSCRQNPEVFSGLCIKETESGTENSATAIVYRSGRIIIFGAKKVSQCLNLTSKIETIIANLKVCGNMSLSSNG